jgi:NADPH-dependent glutamate synthase beta subunit-like oxidoreductase
MKKQRSCINTEHQGLYESSFEHDACGIGAVVSFKGKSLVVWAIAEGRAAAKEVDTYLMGYTNIV